MIVLLACLQAALKKATLRAADTDKAHKSQVTALQGELKATKQEAASPLMLVPDAVHSGSRVHCVRNKHQR